jgi:hypothetical protein
MIAPSGPPIIRNAPLQLDRGSVLTLMHPKSPLTWLSSAATVFGLRFGVQLLVVSPVLALAAISATIAAVVLGGAAWRRSTARKLFAQAQADLRRQLAAPVVATAAVDDRTWVHLRGRATVRVAVQAPSGATCLAWQSFTMDAVPSGLSFTHATTTARLGGDFDLDDGSGVIARVRATCAQVAGAPDAALAVAVPLEGVVDVFGFARVAAGGAGDDGYRVGTRVVEIEGNESAPVIVGTPA